MGTSLNSTNIISPQITIPISQNAIKHSHHKPAAAFDETKYKLQTDCSATGKTAGKYAS